MSGTSMDGVDVVLCTVDSSGCEVTAAYEHPFPVLLKEEILRVTASDVTLRKVGELDHQLGQLFSEAINTFIRVKHIDSSSIEAVGLHGQTLWHQPEGTYPFTMQLGDPNIVAAETGIKVVADFRRKDMAFGGNGAPFAPAFHYFLFKNIGKSAVVANIGGIANITVLGKPLIGYDTGPGNMLMDAWIQKHQELSYDKDGVWAKEGKVDYSLLDAMMADDYFAQSYPKSTGREKFNLKWLTSHLSAQRSALNAIDVQRTLLEFTALSLSNEVLKFNPDMLMLCGGGAKNSFLVERIAVLMPNIQVGVMAYADSLEAMMMAWLAYKRLHNEYVHLKEVTGATQNSILGAIYQ